MFSSKLRFAVGSFGLLGAGYVYDRNRFMNGLSSENIEKYNSKDDLFSPIRGWLYRDVITQIHEKIVVGELPVSNYRQFLVNYPYSDDIFNRITTGDLKISHRWFEEEFKHCYSQMNSDSQKTVNGRQYFGFRVSDQEIFMGKLLTSFYWNCRGNSELKNNTDNVVFLQSIFRDELDKILPNEKIIGWCFIMGVVNNIDILKADNVKWNRLPFQFLSIPYLRTLLIPCVEINEYEFVDFNNLFHVEGFVSELRTHFPHLIASKVPIINYSYYWITLDGKQDVN
jgi:hypothetical protein